MIFNQCLLPVLNYGAKTLTLTRKVVQRIEVTQGTIEKSMLRLTLRDRVKNTDLLRRTGLTDTVESITTLKWSWAGHIAIIHDDRWTKWIMERRPR